MSQKDERDLKEAVDRAALEWNRIDATLYSDLPQGKKLAVLSHLRTANSKTGAAWAAASKHAQAMGVSTKQAERTMRALREDGVLEEVDRKEGGTVTVKLKSSWIEETERQFIEWRSKRPRTSRAGVENEVEAPRPPACLPPAAHVPTPRPPTCPYPFIDPPEISSDLGQPTVGLATNPQMAPASDSLNLEYPVGVELQMQEPGVVEFGEGIPWVEASTIPPTYAQAVWFDRTIGKLFLVKGLKGSAFYQSLRDEPQWTPDIIARAISNAGARAPSTKARNGGLEALVRTYCGYALEKQQAAGGAARARETAFQKPRAFQP